MNVLLARTDKQHFYFTPFEHFWLLALSRSLESIFAPDGGVIKRRWNIRFFLGLQMEARRPAESDHCCASLCSQGFKSFFFKKKKQNIHGRNEKRERARKKTRWLPTLSPPSISVMIVQYVSISQCWAQSLQIGTLITKADWSTIHIRVGTMCS